MDSTSKEIVFRLCTLTKLISCFRAVAAAMAHSQATEERIYDVRGVTSHQRRMEGIAAIWRLRRSAAAPDVAGDPADAAAVGLPSSLPAAEAPARSGKGERRR